MSAAILCSEPKACLTLIRLTSMRRASSINSLSAGRQKPGVFPSAINSPPKSSIFRIAFCKIKSRSHQDWKAWSMCASWKQSMNRLEAGSSSFCRKCHRRNVRQSARKFAAPPTISRGPSARNLPQARLPRSAKTISESLRRLEHLRRRFHGQANNSNAVAMPWYRPRYRNQGARLATRTPHRRISHGFTLGT
jgi:hypothetical protein